MPLATYVLLQIAKGEIGGRNVGTRLQAAVKLLELGAALPAKPGEGIDTARLSPAKLRKLIRVLNEPDEQGTGT
jgi:hypothetical protein